MILDIAPGQRFGRLVAKAPVPTLQKWVCQCDCGTKKLVLRKSLIQGRTKSCGCYRRDLVTASNQTHKHTGTPTYRSWTAMWARCTNPARKAWAVYGMAGIRVCDEWRSFAQFLKDMGERPPGATLERKENCRGYEQSNCYWANKQAQAWNRRTTVWVEFDGRRMPRSAWARELGVSDGVLTRRLKKFPIAQALSKAAL